MLKLRSATLSVAIFLFCVPAIYGENMLNSKSPVFEIVKWKPKETVSDERMIEAVNDMTEDLKSLKGFLQQTLYKSSNGEWVDIYYWETEKDAHASNASMADKESFKELITLIKPESVTIEIMQEQQSSSKLSFE